jgi:hypothetical protein
MLGLQAHFVGKLCFYWVDLLFYLCSEYWDSKIVTTIEDGTNSASRAFTNIVTMHCHR